MAVRSNSKAAKTNDHYSSTVVAGRTKRNMFYTINPKKYKKMRLGKYEIIPHSMMRGFDCWGAYDMSKYLHISQIRGKIVPSKQIVNKRAGAS